MPREQFSSTTLMIGRRGRRRQTHPIYTLESVFNSTGRGTYHDADPWMQFETEPSGHNSSLGDDSSIVIEQSGNLPENIEYSEESNLIDRLDNANGSGEFFSSNFQRRLYQHWSDETKLEASTSWSQSKSAILSRKESLRRFGLKKRASIGARHKNSHAENYISFLSKGMIFFGSQIVADLENHHEEWNVRVTIYDCDLQKARLWGAMEAVNVPFADASVVTYWEGEIIDNFHYTFITKKWEATSDIDIQHWKRFPPFNQIEFSSFFNLANYRHIFMRWKEKLFVNVQETNCGLTIAGFYYTCLDRATGAIDGFYFDRNSTPYQRLSLRPERQERGMGFSDYAFA